MPQTRRRPNDPASLVLYHFLVAQNVSQPVFANSIGIEGSAAQSIVSHWLNGQAIPVARLLRIREVYPDFPLREYVAARNSVKPNSAYALALACMLDVENLCKKNRQCYGISSAADRQPDPTEAPTGGTPDTPDTHVRSSKNQGPTAWKAFVRSHLTKEREGAVRGSKNSRASTKSADDDLGRDGPKSTPAEDFR